EIELRQLDLPWRLSTLSYSVGFDLGVEYPYKFYGPRTQLAFSQSLWHDRIHVGIGYNFQFLAFFGVIDGFPPELTANGRLAWLNEEVSLDLRDRPLDAHRGFYASLGMEEGGVYTGSQFSYEKFSTQVRGYVPLGDYATLAAEVQFGQILSDG